MIKFKFFLLFIIVLMTVFYSGILYCQQSNIPSSISITTSENGTGTLLKHWHESKGFGTATKGGIAGEVYKVTNLNSSGAGSLRDAVSRSNRLVVFEVGGVIEGGFSVASNVTIAGQTAPYPGITTIKGNIRTDGSNIVISHITHHLGTKVSGHPDAWNVSGSNIVLDHVAVYWGKDETLPIARSSNVTLYKCIIAEGLQFTGHSDGEHSKGLHIQSGNSKLSVIGSLGAHNALRNPRLDGGEAFLANYLVYNWGTGWDHKGPKVYSDDELAGCTECFRKVISLRAGANVTLVGSIGLGGFDSEAEYFLDGHNGSGSAYILDNIIKDQQGNDLKMANTEGEFTGGASGPSGAITLLDSPRIWPEGMEPLPADEALYEVLRTVGPHPGKRNGHNARLVKSVADGTGEIIDSEDEVGGYPNYPATHRPITVPDGAEARQAWLDDLENEVAVDTSIDLSRLYTMVGSEASDKLRSGSGFTYLPAPINIAATLQEFTNVELTWEDNSEDETGFRIERAEADTGSFTQIAELEANVTTYIDSSLKELTLYRYRLMAFNDSLSSRYTPIVEIMTLSPTAPPTAVSDPSPENDAKYVDTAPTLTWEASLNADSYDIYFGTENPPPFVSNQVETTFIPGELEKGIKYYWRIDGKNTNGTTEGLIWSFTVKPDIPAEQIAYWKLDETEGLTASDEEKYGMDGTLMNMDPPLWTTGILGGGLQFDGNDDYIAVPHNGVLDFADESFSISLYVKVETFPSGSIYLVHKGTFTAGEVPGSNGAWFGIEIKNSELRFPIDDNASKSQATLSGVETMLLNKWVHIAAVRDKAEGILKLYVDGEMLASASDGTGSISQDMDLHLGNNSKLDAPLPGVLDEVKLFSYALSDAEVQAELLTSVRSTKETVPHEFVLAQNYPNPFNPSTKIDFSCPKKSHVKLEVFDITGRIVATLIDEVKEAGNHSINFNGSNLSTGIYVYKLTTANNILARKMLLTK